MGLPAVGPLSRHWTPFQVTCGRRCPPAWGRSPATSPRLWGWQMAGPPGCLHIELCVLGSAFSRPHCRTSQMETVTTTSRLCEHQCAKGTELLPKRPGAPSHGREEIGNDAEPKPAPHGVSAQWWRVVTHMAQEDGGNGGGQGSMVGVGRTGEHSRTRTGRKVRGRRAGVGRQVAGAHWPGQMVQLRAGGVRERPYSSEPASPRI